MLVSLFTPEGAGCLTHLPPAFVVAATMAVGFFTFIPMTTQFFGEAHDIPDRRVVPLGTVPLVQLGTGLNRQAR